MDEDGFFDIECDCAELVDCDDTDAAINPDAEEICDDGVDNNCNDQIDEDCVVCSYFTYEDLQNIDYEDCASSLTFSDGENAIFINCPAATCSENQIDLIGIVWKNGNTGVLLDNCDNTPNFHFTIPPTSPELEVCIQLVRDRAAELGLL